MSDKKIGIIVGSIRKDSYNKKIANHLVKNSPKGYEFEMIEIADLPLYNQDYDEKDEPSNYAPFREKIKSLHGVVFVTPEHNRSIPAALKNALDVGSRPYGKNAWNNKPALIISSSISGISGFGANHHLRQSLVFLNVPTLQQPEVYLAEVQNFFDDNGELVKEDTVKFLKEVVEAYLTFAEKITA
ncbi:MAG: NAD(P)H-dependent oxidoreductase [Pedobacter sp.]|nr:MAG: NAD(P)H-dependent oxidoreductase [Pedobacter sp.]